MLKKDRFGKYELQYDTILDHDVYEHLRVTFEVPRGQVTEAIVLLNGKDIGRVRVVRENKKIVGYMAIRCEPDQWIEMNGGRPYKHIGRAAAAIISDFIT
jgi:hypothetical protein